MVGHLYRRRHGSRARRQRIIDTRRSRSRRTDDRRRTAVTRLLATCRSHPIVMAVPAALILIVTLGAVAGSTWLLTGDFSHTEFMVRAIPRHPPLIGVAARVKELGSTPGPSMAYLLYPFYKLFGSSAFGLAAAVDVLHLAGIAGAVVVARRVGGTSIAAFVALTLTATSMAVAPRFFLEPWNVWVPVFAFASAPALPRRAYGRSSLRARTPARKVFHDC